MPAAEIFSGDTADLWRAYADALRPPPDLSPSEFALRHRKTHRIYAEQDGPWGESKFPYQKHAMNLMQEAVRTGKRGVVFMKGGQVGGTDCAINAMLWLKVYLPGPQLFLTSTEGIAENFGRERFEPIIQDCPPLKSKYLGGDMLTKRFTDGKIQLRGGQSVFNLQSEPYRVVVIDEVDSLVESLGGDGDPIKLAEVRTDSYSGQTLMIAYAHPSSRARGAGKLYYESSDQRRAFSTHDCGHAFYSQWSDFQLRQGGDARDPAAYVCICPGCGKEVTEAQRLRMVREVEFKSVLPPEEAAKKLWIGAQFGQLLAPHKTLRMTVERFTECGEDENAKKVFFNKVIGETYEPKIRNVDLEALRSLIVMSRRDKDPEFYSRGQVPPHVLFLTAGQDTRSTQLHFAVWGWGLRRAIGVEVPLLCGWLIDWGCIDRKYSLTFDDAEFHVFDDLVYRRSFPGLRDPNRRYHIVQCAHDVGWAPTQIPIIRYCRNFPNRAFAAKGASVEATSACRRPAVGWGSTLKHIAGEEVIQDESSRLLLLNTYLLKTELYGWMDPNRKIDVMDEVIGPRKLFRLALPEDVDEQFLEESKNEALGPGKKNGELVWLKQGPNHFADCTTYALGLALNLDIFAHGKTTAEYEKQQQQQRRRPSSQEAGGARPDERLEGSW